MWISLQPQPVLFFLILKKNLDVSDKGGDQKIIFCKIVSKQQKMKFLMVGIEKYFFYKLYQKNIKNKANVDLFGL